MTTPFNTDPSVRYGVAEALALGVRRVTCRNPSAMTFTGTQSYLVGRGSVAVIDPGPEDPTHLAALEAALEPGEEISHILVTHSHRDHSPGARILAERHGAPVLGFGPHGAGMSASMTALLAEGAALGGGEGADDAFAPDRCLEDGATVAGRGWRLTALHTPGHLSNHLSFVLEGQGVVFTGDTVMGWATTLVSPPDGDMTALMASLRRLAGRAGDRVYLPGHGHPVARPQKMLAHQIAHREARAEAVLAALAKGPARPAEIAVRVYRDLDPALLPAAERNVFATLLGLIGEGRVAPEGAPGSDCCFRRG